MISGGWGQGGENYLLAMLQRSPAALAQIAHPEGPDLMMMLVTTMTTTTMMMMTMMLMTDTNDVDD